MQVRTEIGIEKISSKNDIRIFAEMLVFPNAKINLGLHILSKRADGFHNIETVFYPVQWNDILEIIPAGTKERGGIQLSNSGVKIMGSAKKNLCVSAYEHLKTKYELPSVQMHLHKMIPVGAGLGGGSSDAAHALMLLNNLFNLNLTKEELQMEAAKLGSDCAFFIHNKPVLAKGRGDEFEKISLTLKGYFLAIIKPDVHVNTAEAYKNVTPVSERKSLKKIISHPIEEWKNSLINDFEKTIFKKFPVIEYIRRELYTYGAIYASMSGSGSAVYGIFKDEINLESSFDNCQTWSGWLD